MMENWCPCPERFVTPRVRRALALAACEDSHFMISRRDTLPARLHSQWAFLSSPSKVTKRICGGFRAGGATIHTFLMSARGTRSL
jgi:hypothetical protein